MVVGSRGGRGTLLLRCQKVFSDVKKSHSWTKEEVHKKEFDIMMLRHNEVNFEATFDDHLNYSKC